MKIFATFKLYQSKDFAKRTSKWELLKQRKPFTRSDRKTEESWWLTDLTFNQPHNVKPRISQFGSYIQKNKRKKKRLITKKRKMEVFLGFLGGFPWVSWGFPWVSKKKKTIQRSSVAEIIPLLEDSSRHSVRPALSKSPGFV